MIPKHMNTPYSKGPPGCPQGVEQGDTQVARPQKYHTYFYYKDYTFETGKFHGQGDAEWIVSNKAAAKGS
jgi:hypothetical protein